MIRKATPDIGGFKPVDPSGFEGKIAWLSAIHDAAEQYEMHCTLKHRCHDSKLLSRELKLTFCSLMYSKVC